MSPAEYKAEYEHYLQHRIESELACQQLALCIPQLQNRATLEPPSPQPFFKTRLGVRSARARPLCLLWVRLAWAAPTVPGGGRPSHPRPAAFVPGAYPASPIALPFCHSPIPLPFCHSGEMLEARYHESLSRLLPPSPLVPQWREDCAMEDESSAHGPPATPLMRDSLSPLMEISVSAQLPRFDLECRKRSSAVC